MRVIIAAAGTAGHINPGLAIANKIKKKRRKRFKNCFYWYYKRLGK